MADTGPPLEHDPLTSKGCEHRDHAQVLPAAAPSHQSAIPAAPARPQAEHTPTAGHAPAAEVGAGPARSNRARHQLGQGLVVLAALAWSTAGLFTRMIPLDPWTIMVWRGVFGALTALLFVLVAERGRTVRAFLGMGWAGLQFSLLSAIAMVAFVSALKMTTVAHVAIIYATVPLMAAGLGLLVLGERVSAATLVASLMAMVGIVLTVINGVGEGSLAGDGVALVMTVLMAVMIIVMRQAHRAVPLVPAVCLSAVLGSLIALPFAAPLSPSPSDLTWIALFGTTNMGFGFILFMYGARLVPAAESALLSALDAPLAPIWVWLAFGEIPKGSTLIGGGIVFAAVLGHIAYDSRKTPP